jgi:colanic acid biosynthesis protein WcaH
MFLDNKTFSTIIKNTPLISIDLIVKNKNKEILLGKRLNKPAQNSWFVPGGRIYKNETISDAFKRITKDELNLDINIENSKFYGLYEHFYNDNVFDDTFSTHYIVLAHEIYIENIPITNNQHSTYKWFSIKSLINDENVYSYTKNYFIKKGKIK